ncbi:MAG TPA: hypothetical protein VN610_01750 [Bryobacteraceae bacterium]|nr:hypothetical protein [Bryobacteraceae bacterium]
MGGRFLYHAQAVGLSGRIVRPFDALVKAQAASALSSSGGYSSARRREYHLKQVFSHQATYTEATGSFNAKGDSHDTSATATIEEFNVGGVVKVELGVARISSSHAVSGDREPSISPQGTFLRHLTIAGNKIELESLVDDFHELDTLSKVRDRYKQDKAFREKFDSAAFVGRQSAIEDEKKHKYFPWRSRKPSDQLPEYRGLTIVPLFIIKNPSSPGFNVHGNTVHVDNFGRIQLGEMVIGSHERRVTLIHVDLGSPTEGHFTACGVVGNGGATDP